MNQATGKAQEVYEQTKETVLGQVCPGALQSCCSSACTGEKVLDEGKPR